MKLKFKITYKGIGHETVHWVEISVGLL